jgi:hypothetical protein
MPIFRYEGGGIWYEMSDVYRYEGSGVWYRMQSVYRYDGGGIWQVVYGTAGPKPSAKPTLSQATNAQNLVVLTGTVYRWNGSPTSQFYSFEKSSDGGLTYSSMSGYISMSNPAVGVPVTFDYTIPTQHVSANVLNRYRFVARATNVNGTTNEQAIYIATIQGPTDVTLTAGTATSNTQPITWTASTGALRYQVQYSSNNGQTYTNYSFVSGTSETLSGLDAALTYLIRVIPYTGTSSTYNGYAGNPSNTVTKAGAGLGQVTGLDSSGLTYNQQTNNYQTGLFWDTLTGANSYMVQYRSTTIGGSFPASFQNYGIANGAATNSFLLTGLFNGYSYQFRVVAYSGANATGSAGTPSDPHLININNTPQAFSIFSATKAYPQTSAQGAVRSISFSWTESTYASGYQYQIESSPDGITWGIATTNAGVAINYQNFFVSNTTTSISISANYAVYYRVSVRARASYNTTYTYAESSNNGLEATGSAPGSILIYTYTPSSGTINVSYTEPSNKGSNFFQGAKYSIDNGATWSSTQTSNPFNITGLTGASYVVRIRAVNYDELESFPTSPQTVNMPAGISSVTVSPSTGIAGTTQFTADVTATNALSYKYQWRWFQGGSFGLGGWAPISGATSQTYTPPTNYISLYGTTLRVSAIAYSGANQTGTATAEILSSNSATLSPPNTLVSPNPTSVTYSNGTFSINFTGGTGSWFQGWYQIDNPSLFGVVTSNPDAASQTSPMTDVMTALSGSTYYWWVRAATSSTAIGTGNVSGWNGPVSVFIPSGTTTTTTAEPGTTTTTVEPGTTTTTAAPSGPCPPGQTAFYGNICTASDVANDWFGFGCASIGAGNCSAGYATGSSCLAFCA